MVARESGLDVVVVLYHGWIGWTRGTDGLGYQGAVQLSQPVLTQLSTRLARTLVPGEAALSLSAPNCGEGPALGLSRRVMAGSKKAPLSHPTR